MMKKNLLFPGIVAASLISLPAYATSSQPAAPTVAADRAANKAANAAAVQKAMLEIGIFRIFDPISRELVQPYSLYAVTPAKLRALDKFTFSPASQATLKEFFGTEQPILISTREVENGALEVNFLMRALNYTDPKNGNVTSWDILTGKHIYAKDLRSMHSEFSWPMFSQTIGANFAVTAHDLQVNQDIALNAHRLPLGTAQLTMAQLEFYASSGSDKRISMQGLQMSAGFTQSGKTLELNSEVKIAATKLMQREVGPVHMEYRLANLNEPAIGNLFQKMQKLGMTKTSLTERTQVMQKIKPAEFLAMLTPESRFELKDFSVNYQNWTAVLSGAVWLDHVTQAELSQPKILKDKLALHFELSMPRALALKIAKNVGRLQGAPAADSDQNAEKLLQNLGLQGMFSEDGDNLRSKFDFSHGVMNLNGHVLGGAKK